MDHEMYRRIVGLRELIGNILVRRDGGHEFDTCLALSVLFQFVWMEPPYCPPVRVPSEIAELSREQFAEMMENGWRSWGTPFASLSLPIPGFQDEALCEVALIIDEDESLHYESFDEETQEFKPSDRTDNVEARRQEFQEVFDAVAEIATLGCPGENSKEFLLSQLVKCFGKTERWKPTFQRGCVVSYIEAYSELDCFLEERLNQSKVTGVEKGQAASNQVPFASPLVESGAMPTLTSRDEDIGTAIEADFVFRPDGDGYFLRGFGEEGHVTAKGATGLHDIFRLVQSAGALVPMVELNAGRGIERLRDSHSIQDTADAQTLKDTKAKWHELKEDIENADSEMEKSELQDQLEKLDTEASKLWGLMGKTRDLNNPFDKLRPRIYGRLRDAYRRLKTCEPKPFPVMGEQFELGISAAGPCFKYTPPIPGLRWQTEPNK